VFSIDKKEIIFSGTIDKKTSQLNLSGANGDMICGAYSQEIHTCQVKFKDLEINEAQRDQAIFINSLSEFLNILGIQFFQFLYTKYSL
jgi:hypothetical protein